MKLSITAVGFVFLVIQPAGAEDISFNRDIRPILSNSCFACHGPDAGTRKAKLRLDTEEGALAKVIVRGKPAESPLVQRITSTESNEQMPPRKSGKKLTPKEIELLTRWVKQGAPYSKHWSYVKPARPALPQVKDKGWPKNGIDYFILSRLEREGLTPMPEADRYAIVRRVSLDLIGLPPTVAEVDAAVNDKSPDWYEKVVDRLLKSPRYGEHWGHHWLDLARYADSAGYADDPARTIWLFRDYVIKALNDNKPFDQFTIEQIAGDLLPHPTEEQLIATAFHRNTLTNNEGGTSDEEFRNVAVVDRVNTTFAVWMGTTMACAQCHDHKYDPIKQEEFFRFFAFFNNSEDSDKSDERPVLSKYTPEQTKERDRLQADIARLTESLRWVPADIIPQATNVRIKELAEQMAAAKPLTVPIMRELPAKERRKTNIQHRGNFLDVGKEVSEGTPAVFPPLPAGEPMNRLTVAKWLVGEENPLTGRVIANRYWEQLFGIGIVSSSEEFGIQGELPVQPELLDWLATELVSPSPQPSPSRGEGATRKWDTKAFVKTLVVSAAYRQSSKVTPELQQRDPDNRLLARGPRFRLSAEMVRDQALHVSGLLSPKMYGPPVKPMQPTSGLAAAFGSGIDWQTSAGEDKYRRALYTTWRRSNPYPSMAAFDAPNREVCTVRRVRTNTPLQALVTLNDPVYIEAAQALARKIVAEGGKTTSDKARYAFRACLSRPPQEEELKRLVGLYEKTMKELSPFPAQAKSLATEPLGAAPQGMNVTELAAWTVAGNVLLNLDEMVMKR